MNLKEFATKAGVIVERCDPIWGGTWAYRTKDSTHCSIRGFKSESRLYKSWAKNTFGKECSYVLPQGGWRTCYKALQALLDESEDKP